MHRVVAPQLRALVRSSSCSPLLYPLPPHLTTSISCSLLAVFAARTAARPVAPPSPSTRCWERRLSLCAPRRASGSWLKRCALGWWDGTGHTIADGWQWWHAWAAYSACLNPCPTNRPHPTPTPTQVVHHPTVIAAVAEGRRWRYEGDADVKSKFWGRSIELRPEGERGSAAAVCLLWCWGVKWGEGGVNAGGV